MLHIYRKSIKLKEFILKGLCIHDRYVILFKSHLSEKEEKNVRKINMNMKLAV